MQRTQRNLDRRLIYVSVYLPSLFQRGQTHSKARKGCFLVMRMHIFRRRSTSFNSIVQSVIRESVPSAQGSREGPLMIRYARLRRPWLIAQQ